MSDFLTRHSRTILLNEINYEGQKNISQSKVLLVGAGGIASSIISILASSGVEEIVIWEADKLELSNLQRQFIFQQSDVGRSKVDLAKNFALNLNSKIKITAINKELNEESFSEFNNCVKNIDIIIDSTDSFKSRVLSNMSSIKNEKPFFTGSAIGFEGQVYSFFGSARNLPCYSCLFGSNYKEFVEKRTCSNSGVFPPIPTIIGSLIAQNALHFLATEKCDFLKFILVNFCNQNYFKEIKMKKDPKCKACKIN
jgi:molybdopterin-synthase adenylyltransferase